MRNRRTSLRSIAVGATVAVGATLLGFTPGAPGSIVGAQSVESLRASARRAADELSRLQGQSDRLNEQYLQAQEDVAALKDRQAQNRKEVDAAQGRLDQARSEASSYLVEAYIGARADASVVVGSSDPNEAVNQKVLLSMLKSDRVQLADKLEVTKSDLDALTKELNDTGARLDKRLSDQAKVVADLEKSVADQRQILDGANSQLNAAIRAEQARREAEAAARAQREEEARARRQAQARETAARAATTAQSGARRAVGGSGVVSRSARQTPRGDSPNSGGGSKGSAFVPPAVVSPPSSGAAGAINAARSRLGTPYRWGGASPSGFDCSGLMMWSYAQVGISLPRTSGAQKAATQRISYSQLQPGDLVFSGNPVYHVGMYIGGGQMIHSPHTGDVVKISPVRAGGSTSYGRVR